MNFPKVRRKWSKRKPSCSSRVRRLHTNITKEISPLCSKSSINI
nr:MAG TPA: hypothetical protein [Caudoviricetes sp.]